MTSTQAIEWTSQVVEVDDDLDRFQDQAMAMGWSDGLPVVPPTPERVERMLAAIDRDRDLSVFSMAPAFGDCTIEKIAISAVMAGCLPEYMPVVVAIVEAASRPQFNMLAIQTTTHPCGIMAWVNGPIAAAIGLNGSSGALGPGFRANSTIGRAVRLIQQNIGGAYPGTTDLATQGSPLKFGLCFAENEAESPWAPYHVTKGFASTDSVVTIQAAEGPNAVKDHTSKTAKQLLTTFQQSMAIIGKGNPFQKNLELTVGLGPEHVAILHKDGVSREDFQTYIYERARIPYRIWSKSGTNVDLAPRWVRYADEDALIPMCSSPEKLHVYVVGGPGKHSVWASGSGASQIVSRRIEMADGSPWMPRPSRRRNPVATGGQPVSDINVADAAAPRPATSTETKASVADAAGASVADAAGHLIESLMPVREMLRVDGYDLVSHEDGGSSLRLEIVAGPDACAECLVPKAIFQGIVGQYLTAPFTVDDLEITYPADHDE